MNRVIRHLRRTAITTTTTRSSTHKCHASLVMEATNARCSSQVVNNTHFNINTHQINRSFSTQQHYGNVNMGAILPFNLADIGEGIKEVEIVSWNVKEGDKINEFDLVRCFAFFGAKKRRFSHTRPFVCIFLQWNEIVFCARNECFTGG